MRQSWGKSLEENVARTFGMALIWAPLITMVWLEHKGCPSFGYFHSLWVNTPFILAAIAWGLAVRRYYDRPRRTPKIGSLK